MSYKSRYKGKEVDDTLDLARTALQPKDIEGIGVEVPIIDHGTGDTTFVLTPNILHKWGTVTSLTLTLAVPTDTTVANYYMVQFTCGSSATSLNLPDTIKWITEPNIEANKTYQISILDNLGVIGGA